MAELKLLMSPIKIGSKLAKNRIVSTPHATGYGRDGYPTQRYLDYYAYKAKGGVGVIQPFGSTSVHPSSLSSDWGGIHNWDDSIIPWYAKFAAAAHQYGALLIPQISHRGRRGSSKLTGAALYAPSDEPEEMHHEIPHVMTKQDIREFVRAYGAAAVRCQKAGCDGVDLAYWGAHLQEQFWSPRSNFRTDEYGGDLVNRMRFAVEVLEEVREQVGRDFIVGVRLTGDEMLEGGLGHQELKEIAARLNDLGLIDYFTISGGSAQTLKGLAVNMASLYYPHGVFNNLAASMKEVISVPVIVAGRIVDPVEAEEVLQNGSADLVAMTRALIADPELPKKASEGRLDDIRTCMGANEYCIGRLYAGLPISCTQNPVIGLEPELGEIQPAPATKKVVVVGGGPAGMEAARVARLRGHAVVLFEQEHELGGQIRAAARAPDRAEYGGSIQWLERQVRKLGVDVRTGVTASAESVLAEQPDTVIICTGSVSRRPRIPGIDAAHVVGAEDVLLGRDGVGRRVLVLDQDGHMRGPSAAQFLAQQGKDVEIVTSRWAVGEELDDTLRPAVYTRLFKAGVTLTPHMEVREIAGSRVRLRNVWSEQEHWQPADTVVLALGGRARDQLYHALTGRVPELYLAGDAMAPRRLHDALLDASRAARAV
jgi:mycofactocin system FadH/OYE family oxidoreductase 2